MNLHPSRGNRMAAEAARAGADAKVILEAIQFDDGTSLSRTTPNSGITEDQWRRAADDIAAALHSAEDNASATVWGQQPGHNPHPVHHQPLGNAAQPLDILAMSDASKQREAMVVLDVLLRGGQLQRQEQFSQVRDSVIKMLAAIALQRPVDRVKNITYVARIGCITLRANWTIHIWRSQLRWRAVLLPPCTWCGHPTGNWCASCGTAPNPPPWRLAVCNECDERYGKCRECFLGPVAPQPRPFHWPQWAADALPAATNVVWQ